MTAALGGATNLDVAVEGLSSVMNAFGRENVSASQTADLLFSVVRTGSVRFNELAPVIGRVALPAANAGQSFQEFGAALAQISRTIPQAGEMTTAYRGVVLSLMSPQENARKALEKYGISYGQAALNAKGLSGVMTEVYEKTKGDAELVRKIFPERRAWIGALSLMADEMSGYNYQLAEHANQADSAGEAAEKMKDRAGFAFQKLKTNLENLKIAVGQLNMEALSPLAEWMGKIVVKMREAVQESSGFGQAIAGTITVLSGTTFVLGSVLAMLGQLGYSFLGLSQLIATFPAVLGALKVAFGGLASFLMSPVVLAIGAVIGAAFGLRFAINKIGEAHAKSIEENEKVLISIKKLEERYGEMGDTIKEVSEKTTKAAHDEGAARVVNDRLILESMLGRVITTQEYTKIIEIAIAEEMKTEELAALIKEAAARRKINAEDMVTVLTTQSIEKRISMLQHEEDESERTTNELIDDLKRETDSRDKSLRKWRKMEQEYKEIMRSSVATDEEKREAQLRWKDATIELMKSQGSLADTTSETWHSMLEETRVTGEAIGKPIRQVRDQVADLEEQWVDFFKTAAPDALSTAQGSLQNWAADLTNQLQWVNGQLDLTNQKLQGLNIGHRSSPSILELATSSLSMLERAYRRSGETIASIVGNLSGAVETSLANTLTQMLRPAVAVKLATAEAGGGYMGPFSVNFFGNVTNETAANNLAEVLQSTFREA